MPQPTPLHPFDLLVFDWDGTLMDSTATIVRSLQRGFADVGLPVPPEADCRYIIGFGLADAMQYLCPQADAATIQALVHAYRHHFIADEAELTLFPGVEEGLAQLEAAGYLLAIATGKARQGLDRLLVQTGLGPRFVATRCADEGFSKPHPGMLNYLLDVTGTTPNRALMIGDTTHDLQLARNAGTASVAMTYGAHALPPLLELQPLAHFDHFTMLTNWLL